MAGQIVIDGQTAKKFEFSQIPMNWVSHSVRIQDYNTYIVTNEINDFVLVEYGYTTLLFMWKKC